MRMRSSNPALSQFENFDVFSAPGTMTSAMTIEGTAIKSIVLVALTILSATWSFVQLGYGTFPVPLGYGMSIVGFVIALVLMFKPSWSPVLGPVYAICKGLFLGVFTKFVAEYTGSLSIPTNALLGTMGVLVSMLGLYGFRIIKITDKVRMWGAAAALGVCFVFLANFVVSLITGSGFGFLSMTNGGPLAIGFTLLCVGIGAFMLLLDFDMIERGVENGAPKWMEWYGGYALLVSLIWIYIQLVRLLMQLQSSD